MAAAPPAPSTAAPAAQPAAAPSTSAGGLTAADLQRAMASLQALTQQQPKSVSLVKLLTNPANLQAILSDASCVEQLLPHLPEGAQNAAELQATIRSPQLRQSISSLVQALQTGNFNAVLTNFGLDPSAGASKLAFGDSVGAFLAAIQQWADQQNTTMEDTSADQTNASS